MDVEETARAADKARTMMGNAEAAGSSVRKAEAMVAAAQRFTAFSTAMGDLQVATSALRPRVEPASVESVKNRNDELVEAATAPLREDRKREAERDARLFDAADATGRALAALGVDQVEIRKATVSLAESDRNSRWQRAVLAIVSVAALAVAVVTWLLPASPTVHVVSPQVKVVTVTVPSTP